MIISAIARAYKIMNERNWDKIYWCIDLHDTVLKANYNNDNFEFVNTDVINALHHISSKPESVIILWSSCHEEQQHMITKMLNDHGIRVDYFNENPEVPNTKTGNFDKKFYFSILIDDKAGFDYRVDWANIQMFLN